MSYPIFVETKGVKIVFVGGGRIALRKLRKLLSDGALISVIAPKIIDEIKQLEKTHQNLTLIEDSFDTLHLNGAALVFLVSDNSEVNKIAGTYCLEHSILYNDCMNVQKSRFRNGAALKRGAIEIAIGSGGKRPGVSKWLIERVEKAIPDNIDEIVNKYDALRKTARLKYNDSKLRESYIKEAFSAYLEQLEGRTHED